MRVRCVCVWRGGEERFFRVCVHICLFSFSLLFLLHTHSAYLPRTVPIFLQLLHMTLMSIPPPPPPSLSPSLPQFVF